MSVIRVHKTANYTVMSNYHFKERGLSLKAKGLLSLMLSLPDDWSYSVSGLVTLSKDGKDSVMSALGELEKYGYLKRERVTNDKGQFSGIEYNIYEQPQQEKATAEKQTADNPILEKPTAEKPQQLNTNQSITNLKNNINELNTNEFGELLANIADIGLRDLYKDYLKMRDNIDAPLTASGLKMLMKRNEKLSKSSVQIQKLLLETAIINNWKNVYTPNEAELTELNTDKINALKSDYGLE